MNSDSCCAVCPPTRKPHCSAGQDWEWNTTTCAWDEVDVNPGACYNSGGITYIEDTWLSTSCSYTTTSSVDLEPSAGTCETVAWDGAGCAWEVSDSTPTDPGGCPGQGQAWDLQGCAYVAVSVSPIACDGTLEWEDCGWKCIVLDITLSFPTLISEQTSAATYEQNLDVTFNSDGSITLMEQLVGPDSSRTISLGYWAHRQRCGASLIGGGIPLGRNGLGSVFWFFQLDTVLRIRHGCVRRSACGPSSE